MTLTDTGPLLALLLRSEPDHARCVSALDGMRGPLLSTWPVFTEAMHILGHQAGRPPQATLWDIVRRGDLILADLTAEEMATTRTLMEKFQNTPLDLPDASLVAVARHRRLREIFTLDRHFRFYRVDGRRTLRMIP